MELFQSHFEYCSLGPFKRRRLKKAFPMGKTEFLMGRKDKILFNLGLIPSQGSIIETANGKILKVVYPFGRFGPLPGSQWKVKFQDTEIVCLSYKLYIPDDFDFMKGGKLPGLGGGKGNTGGDVPNGFDGWSVRFMFKEEGTICAYLYYPDMPDQFGEKVFLKSGGVRFLLSKEQWLKIGLEVQMNTLGAMDGFIRCFVDGELMLEKKGLAFRYHDDLKADHLLFSSFFGGADSSYAPLNNCHLLFKDFIVEKLI